MSKILEEDAVVASTETEISASATCYKLIGSAYSSSSTMPTIFIEHESSINYIFSKESFLLCSRTITFRTTATVKISRTEHEFINYIFSKEVEPSKLKNSWRYYYFIFFNAPCPLQIFISLNL